MYLDLYRYRGLCLTIIEIVWWLKVVPHWITYLVLIWAKFCDMCVLKGFCWGNSRSWWEGQPPDKHVCRVFHKPYWRKYNSELENWSQYKPAAYRNGWCSGYWCSECLHWMLLCHTSAFSETRFSKQNITGMSPSSTWQDERKAKCS